MNPVNRLFTIAATIVSTLIAACGGSTEQQNVYNNEQVAVRIRTIDQFGNTVNGVISSRNTRLGAGEVQVTKVPGQYQHFIEFQPLGGFETPPPVDLSQLDLHEGEIITATYRKLGQVANLCPRAVDANGNQAAATLAINGRPVRWEVGDCQVVNIDEDNEIASKTDFSAYGYPIFIPKGMLIPDQTYGYEIAVLAGEKTAFVATTPYAGEIFIDGNSRGWIKNPSEFVAFQFPPGKEFVTVSFGSVPGHQAPDPFVLMAGDLDNADSKSNHFWGLYDASVNALTCFSALNGSSKDSAKVKVDNDVTLTGQYNVPACIGLNASKSHTAEYLKRDFYQSKDILSISKDSHIGCTGEFKPGERLDCVGNYFYVNPDESPSQYYVSVVFTGNYHGNTSYPVQGRLEVDGVNKDWSGEYSFNLEPGEKKVINLLPLGIIPPSVEQLTINADNLSKEDGSYDPEKSRWTFEVQYVPPTQALETCLTALNQNGLSITNTVSTRFDGAYQINNSSEDKDCHWLMPENSHVIVTDGIPGYTPSVFQIYVPVGKLPELTEYQLPFVPNSTRAQVCVLAVPTESKLSLNGSSLGWTNIGDNCIWLDKSQNNEITIDGKGSKVFTAEDPDLSSGFLQLPYENFLYAPKNATQYCKKLVQAPRCLNRWRGIRSD